MSRRNKLLIWLAGIIALLGLCYASLPWVLVGLIKHNLAARGLSDIKLRVDHPNWHGIRLHSLAFTAIAGEQQFFCEVPNVEVTYHLMELVTGTVARIRVPVVAVRIQSAAGSAPFGQTTALPLATLLSGQWLSQLPVRELLLEQLSAEARTPADTVYTLQLSGELRDAQLQVNGDIRLPKPAQRPIVFSINAQHTGEVRLLVSSIDQTATPMLDLRVNPVAVDKDSLKQDPIDLNGVLTAKLDTLVPMVLPLLGAADWKAGLEGYLKSHWQAKVTDSHWQVTGEAAVHALGGRWRDQVLPRGELTSKFDVDSQRVTLSSTLRVAEQAVVLETKGVHQFASGDGHADLTLRPVVFSDAGFVLSRLRKDWPYPFDITAGRVSGSGRLVWQKAIVRQLEPQIFIKLNKLGGHYSNMIFAGLSGELALTYGEGVRTSKDAQLHIDVVDIGFPVEKIDVRFALAPLPKTVLPLVRVQSFNAQLLGGTARSGPFELNFGRDKNAFVVQLEQIGLNDIMKLEQQEGLEGSGVLDGQIPIEISSKDIFVTHGQLSARKPGGVIRYTPTPKVAALAQSNASVGMMVKALSNFRYQVLDVISNYKPGGDLTLQVRLEGKNPDWQRGQPVNLNLNLHENIPALLRSLQLSEDITERVRKRYQDTE